MTKKWRFIKNFLYGIFVMLVTLPVWADLPTPPPEDQATGSQDWIDVGGSMMYRVATYAAILLGAVILFAAAANIITAYRVAHKKEDLGHFFQQLIVGLVAAAIGLGLVYAGFSIIPSHG